MELRFLYPGQSDSAQEQEQLLRREVESGASAILLFPADREALAQEVRAASSRAALVTLETDMADTAGYVGVDNAALGEALGRAALNGVPSGGTVLLVTAASQRSGVGDRLTAAEALLQAEGREVRYFAGTADALTEALSQGGIQAVIAFEASSLERAAAAVSSKPPGPPAPAWRTRRCSTAPGPRRPSPRGWSRGALPPSWPRTPFPPDIWRWSPRRGQPAGRRRRPWSRCPFSRCGGRICMSRSTRSCCSR